LLDLGRSFSSLIYTRSVGLLGRGISPVQGRYLYTGQHKHRKAYRLPYREWDLKSQAQGSSKRRQRGHYDPPKYSLLLLLEWLYSPCGPSPLFSFLIYFFFLQSAGLLE
jgi:hypothetical protein